MKIMDKAHIKRKNLATEVSSEKTIMAALNCEYIVRLFYCLQVSQPIDQTGKLYHLYLTYEYILFSGLYSIANLESE